MRKEVLLAIVIGVGLGLILVFGIWTANRALKEKGGAVSPTPGANLTPTPASQTSLTILSPEDGDLFDKDKVLVSGTAGAGANLIVLADKQELPVVAGETGKWEVTVSLTAGENEIKVVGFDKDSGMRSEKTVTVVYSTKFDTP